MNGAWIIVRPDGAVVDSQEHFVDSAKADRQCCSQSKQKFQEGARVSFLDRNRTVAKPGFSRWMVPPAALCVHL
jgi:hypothetical protein